MRSRCKDSQHMKEPTLKSSSVGTTSFFKVSRTVIIPAGGSLSFSIFCNAVRRWLSSRASMVVGLRDDRVGVCLEATWQFAQTLRAH
jgi:hypothetical protein